MGIRVLVCGSRSWSDGPAILARLSFLSALCPTIVHGGARGADRLADVAASTLHFPVEVHPADWNGRGRAAGMVRNLEMLESGIDLVIAFRIGKSPGTLNTITEARCRGIPVEVIEGGAL